MSCFSQKKQNKSKPDPLVTLSLRSNGTLFSLCTARSLLFVTASSPWLLRSSEFVSTLPLCHLGG